MNQNHPCPLIMVSKKSFFILIALLTAAISVYGLMRLPVNKPLGVSTEAAPQGPSHEVSFFDEKTFYEGVNKTKNDKAFDYQISGGIIPHDYFQGFIIASFFKRLSAQKPATIVLLGPNHFEKGKFKVLTSLYNWNTLFGVVVPQAPIIKALIERDLLEVDEETLPNDHSISAILPFIKYYLPAAKIVPIMLSGTVSQDESEKLANALSSLIDKDTVVIAAVDFSHYLISTKAQEKDKITKSVIDNFDYRQLYLMNNDYLDSPPSIGTLLMVMQKKNTTKMDVLYHSNSGELQDDNNISTTSYYSLTFR